MWGGGGLDTGHVKWPETKQKTDSSFCLSHLKQTGAGERSSSGRGPSPQTGPFCARSLALITFVENTRAISPLGFLSFLSVAAWRCFSSHLAKLGQLQVAFSFLIVKQFANHMQFQLLLLLLLLLTDFCHTPNCRLLLFSPRPSVGHLAVVIAAFPVYYMIINEMPQLWPRHKGKEQKITETETETNQRTNPGIPTYDLHTHKHTHAHTSLPDTASRGAEGGQQFKLLFCMLSRHFPHLLIDTLRVSRCQNDWPNGRMKADSSSVQLHCSPLHPVSLVPTVASLVQCHFISGLRNDSSLVLHH